MGTTFSRLDLSKAVDVDVIINRLLKYQVSVGGKKQQFPLSIDEIEQLCWNASEQFLQQPSLLQLHPPINICDMQSTEVASNILSTALGSINGQYLDLLKIFELGGHPPDTNYVFLGDYVDHSDQNLLTICLLLAYKIRHPENFFLLRGDNESSNATASQRLKDECEQHRNCLLWDHFVDCFESMPVAAIICEKIFCVHGGLAPDLDSLSKITNIMRPADIPTAGLLHDLLHSNPDPSVKGWVKKSDRGFLCAFGPDVVTEFLKKNDLKLICRSHQVAKDGYKFFADNQLVTICSAPNCLGQYQNSGAIMRVDNSLSCSIQAFDSVISGESSKLAAPIEFGLSSLKTRKDVEESPAKKHQQKPKPEPVVAGDKCSNEDFNKKIELLQKNHANEQQLMKKKLSSAQQEKDELQQKLESEKQLMEKQLSSAQQEKDELQQKLELKKQLMKKRLSLAQQQNEKLRQKLESIQHDRNRLQLALDSKANEVEELRAKKDQISVYEFSFLELQQATDNFSNLRNIGQGGFSIVYRGSLRGITVAIKMLRPEKQHGQAAFYQEVAVLSRVRGPNLVNLIGVCSEAYALVYEFLENGSLEDRLARKNNTPKLCWRNRTRIIAEIRSSLIFLHSTEPRPVVHGDLKPDNILLDANLTSKLGDFGICCFLSDSSTGTPHHMTNPRGTPGYIDPEFHKTREITAKSDVYSFGIIILRLLTGRPPSKIVERVENALRSGKLLLIVDRSAGTWPFAQAEILAQLGVKCAGLDRKLRPDLAGVEWAEFEEKCKWNV